MPQRILAAKTGRRNSHRKTRLNFSVKFPTIRQHFVGPAVLVLFKRVRYYVEMVKQAFLMATVFGSITTFAAIPQHEIEVHATSSTLKSVFAKPKDPPLMFDIPMAYNADVRTWVRYFQTRGRPHFERWLERSHRHLPLIQEILMKQGLPRDLSYMAMIESGFYSNAVSTASAVGPWQFIKTTGNQYGLKTNYWLDERRDFEKSTRAAAKYLKNLYSIFGAWHLVAAGYNAGENYMLRIMSRHGARNFWALSAQGVLHDETKNYVPKLIAAALIAKAPSLYGFRDIRVQEPLEFEYFFAPGGTKIKSLADYLGVTDKYMQELNPELLIGYIPNSVSNHLIRIPKGSLKMVSQYFRKNVAAN